MSEIIFDAYDRPEGLLNRLRRFFCVGHVWDTLMNKNIDEELRVMIMKCIHCKTHQLWIIKRQWAPK